ncbi:hypothetical protein DAPPUDRAFT_121513 [Daphnia pulex]|uniref:Uncharacterized protein n=1 Tax=Daphnia pulex TaxID=6669 RepID=E9I381_DAPPU|nr:hypothetical protein DAPPUDRAFT_121513 [Daphnia pulex]|eukprot:EFX61550.1 hypothetical protein DAPPUDRAFT_121513 [Daphnia pulex]
MKSQLTGNEAGQTVMLEQLECRNSRRKRMTGWIAWTLTLDTCTLDTVTAAWNGVDERRRSETGFCGRSGRLRRKLPAGQFLPGPEESATATEFSATRDFRCRRRLGSGMRWLLISAALLRWPDETPTAW